tara:strand:+ start:971 stop:1144 length:174 start_codon:yes stop_codon:yes gene_type:complete
MKTEYIKLTDLWFEREYAELGYIIKEEEWSNARIAAFCAYFAKYVGLKDLGILYKFL